MDRILDYLREHPESGDTLEGIARWWIQRQQVHDSVNAVQSALRQLEDEGVIEEQRGPDGRLLYFVRRQADS